MIAARVKFQGKNLRIAGMGPRKYQMLKIAQYGIQLIRERVSRGIGSDDAPMPGLKVRVSRSGNRYGYAIQKARKGLGNTRNLYGTGQQGGHMLDAIRVTYVDDKRASIDITTRSGRQKARANEQRTPWYGWSRNDSRKLAEFARNEMGSIVNVGVGLSRGRSFGSSTFWMNPREAA